MCGTVLGTHNLHNDEDETFASSRAKTIATNLIFFGFLYEACVT
jgi:hypothetical protein